MTDLKIAFIQSDLIWENRKQNLDHFEQDFELISKVDLVVLPEMFTTGFTMNAQQFSEEMDGVTVNWMKTCSVKYGFAIIGSLIIHENGYYYNRMVFVTPESEIQFYNKRHLFTMGDEHTTYQSGSVSAIFTYRNWKIKPIICYDLRFPVWIRNQEDYHLLICVANWPAVRRDAFITLLKARAIENQCYVVGVNRIGTDQKGVAYAGDSQAIGSKGEIIACLDQGIAGIGYATFYMKDLLEFREKFPVLNDADEFKIIL